MTGKGIWLFTGQEQRWQRAEDAHGAYCNVSESFHIRARWHCVYLSGRNVGWGSYLRINLCVTTCMYACICVCATGHYREVRNQSWVSFLRCCPYWFLRWCRIQPDWSVISRDLPASSSQHTAMPAFLGSNSGPCALYWLFFLFRPTWDSYVTFYVMDTEVNDPQVQTYYFKVLSGTAFKIVQNVYEVI